MSASIATLGSVPYATAVSATLFIYFFLYPLILYLKDTKGKISFLDSELSP
jgi:hypothetical protein